ncbi:uncharacterized protein RHOBADRAFT_65513 [Rhodotorula graminis WP1]|uniref:Uncharacterized protein n=1 Tax=Rhodotorula graminis (strain WP1) TaxID=578459 RepID=A0A0N8PZN2_RHOGW|nr:uncharacterized protein RHOBADRAFT_65513 [Rhodotorula graminis WP1]KPV72797.1 hypothetical protein RHOBADRAFT_65513 [Rhodotorula graminis WP1]
MFGMRAWPTPFLRPMWPFMAGGALTFYGVAKMQSAMLEVPEWRDSPKNPMPRAPAATTAH